MAFKLASRTREKTATTGSGSALVLGGLLPGVTNQKTFNDGLGVGNETTYMLLSGNGIDWEEGVGSLTDATHFSRDTVTKNNSGGTSRITLTGESRLFGIYPDDVQLLLAKITGAADQQYLWFDAATGKFLPTSQGTFTFARVHTLGGAAFSADNYTGFPGDPEYFPGSYGAFEARAARGTEDDPRYPVNNQLLGGLTIWGWDENLGNWRAATSVVSQAAADWSDTTRPARLIIQVNGPEPAGDQWRPGFNTQFDISNGGLTATTNIISVITTIIGNTGQDGARFYAEFTAGINGDADILYGFARDTIPQGLSIGASSSSIPQGLGLSRYGGGHWVIGGSSTANGMAAWADGDIIGIAVDLDLGFAWARNVTVDPAVWYGSGSGTPNPVTGTDGFVFTPFDVALYLAFTSNGNGTLQAATMNAGATPFVGTLPGGGFLAFDSGVGAQNSIIYWEDGGVSLGGIMSMGKGTFNVPTGYYRDSVPLITGDDVAGNLPVIAGGRLLGNSGGSPAAAAEITLSALIDAAIGNTRGSILYRGSTGWAFLTPGTDGYVLTSQGSGADPDWEAGGGSLPTIANGHIIGNSSGGSAAAADATLTAIIDIAIGSTRGAVLYRGASGWAILAPGTSGFALLSNGSGADPAYAAVLTALPTIATGHLLAYTGAGTGAAADATLTAVIDAALGSTRGAVLYRGASGWAILAPGTSGYALLSNGSGADPAYGSVSTALPTIADGHLIGNASGGSAAAADTTLTALIDAALGSTRGSILYRGASGWAILAPGTSGNFLKSNGSGADPAYATVSASMPTIAAGTVLGNSGASSAAAAEATLTAIIDRAIGSTRGSLLRRGASGWEQVTPGAAGYGLVSAGAGADPVYGQVRMASRGAWLATNNYLPMDVASYSGGMFVNLLAIDAGEQWNANYDSRFTITNGGLTATTNVNNQNQTVLSSIGRSTGKWYFEFTNNMNGDADLYWGIAKATHSNGARIGNSTDSVSYHRTGASNGNMVFNNSESNCGFPKPANGSVIGVAVDLDNGLIWVRNPAIPGSWFGNNGASPDPATGTNGYSFTAFGTTAYLGFSSVGNGSTQGVVMNAGATTFVAAAPTGFTAWNTNAVPSAPPSDTTHWLLLGPTVLISTLTASASAQLDWSGLSGTSWKIVGKLLVPATSGATLWLRFGTGTGPTFATANYDYALLLIGSSGFSSNTSGEGQGQITLGSGSVNATPGTSFEITIETDNANWARINGTVTSKSTDGHWYTYVVGGGLPIAAAITGIRLLQSSGNITSGKATLYQLAE